MKKNKKKTNKKNELDMDKMLKDIDKNLSKALKDSEISIDFKIPNGKEDK